MKNYLIKFRYIESYRKYNGIDYVTKYDSCIVGANNLIEAINNLIGYCEINNIRSYRLESIDELVNYRRDI